MIIISKRPVFIELVKLKKAIKKSPWKKTNPFYKHISFEFTYLYSITTLIIPKYWKAEEAQPILDELTELFSKMSAEFQAEAGDTERLFEYHDQALSLMNQMVVQAKGLSDFDAEGLIFESKKFLFVTYFSLAAICCHIILAIIALVLTLTHEIHPMIILLPSFLGLGTFVVYSGYCFLVTKLHGEAYKIQKRSENSPHSSPVLEE